MEALDLPVIILFPRRYIHGVYVVIHGFLELLGREISMVCGNRIPLDGEHLIERRKWITPDVFGEWERYIVETFEIWLNMGCQEDESRFFAIFYDDTCDSI